jgi:hypothetical protein
MLMHKVLICAIKQKSEDRFFHICKQIKSIEENQSLLVKEAVPKKDFLEIRATI